MLSLPILRRVADAAAVSLDRQALLASMAASVVVGTVPVGSECLEGVHAHALHTVGQVILNPRHDLSAAVAVEGSKHPARAPQDHVVRRHVGN